MHRFEIAIVVVVVLGVRPAESHLPLTEAMIHVLTLIDEVPTKQQLVDAFQGQDPASSLVTIAVDSTVDFGVRLRAIRSLPLFCSAPCAGSAVHVTLLGLLAPSPAATKGQLILQRRAAIEALGKARTGDPSDMTSLQAFLNDSSRDLRAASALALRDLCNTQALPALRARYQIEHVEQVSLAISTALRDLTQCGQ
jgi:HEAT repeat protein